MPLPNKEGKTQEQFMGECVPMVIAEGKPQDQAVAICQNAYSQPVAQSKPKGKLELLNSIKRMIEKNGHDISDDSLLELYEKMNTKTEVKTFSLNNSLEAIMDEQIIKVFPKKRVYIEKYNEVIDFNDKLFDEIIKNFNNPKLFKPYIDRDHALEEKYGEIVHLFKDDDGLYAKIQLNDKGEQVVKGNEYSYISPEWGSRINTDKETCRNVLWAITLTNIPALEGELPTLQDQIKLSREKLTKELNMDLDKKLIQLSAQAKTMKLQNEIDPAALMAIVDELFISLDEMKMKYDELKGVADQAQEQVAETQSQLKKIESEKAKQEKETFFNSVLEKGLIEAKELELWQNQYDKDKKFVTDYILSKEPKDDIQLSSNGSNKKDDGLDALDYQIMEERGFDRHNKEDIRLYKLSQGGK